MRTGIGRQGECHIQFIRTNLARHLGCTSGCQDGRPSASGPAGSWLSRCHCVPTRTKILSLPSLFSLQFLCFSPPLSLSSLFSLYFLLCEAYLLSSQRTLALFLADIWQCIGKCVVKFCMKSVSTPIYYVVNLSLSLIFIKYS